MSWTAFEFLFLTPIPEFLRGEITSDDGRFQNERETALCQLRVAILNRRKGKEGAEPAGSSQLADGSMLIRSTGIDLSG